MAALGWWFCGLAGVRLVVIGQHPLVPRSPPDTQFFPALGAGLPPHPCQVLRTMVCTPGQAPRRLSARLLLASR
jgi:hypothetical protein